MATLAAQSEEELALRDKANLSLGYVYLQQNAFDRARNYLQQVRLNSPYSNRALLAMGWIAQQQGRSDEALAPWTELRNRNVTDPAVQESLLAVDLVQDDFIDYLFLAVVSRKASEQELNELNTIIADRGFNRNDRKMQQAMIVLDYLSRLSELYHSRPFEKEVQ